MVSKKSVKALRTSRALVGVPCFKWVVTKIGNPGALVGYPLSYGQWMVGESGQPMGFGRPPVNLGEQLMVNPRSWVPACYVLLRRMFSPTWDNSLVMNSLFALANI